MPAPKPESHPSPVPGSQSALELSALDGTRLAADLFAPAQAPQAAVVIASAMGVPRRLYRAFARYLAQGGIAALTFDYRGIGGSGTASDRRAQLHDWGEQDLGGALRFLSERFPSVPHLYFGHSVGGQLAGLAPGSERLRALVMVGAQHGYWRNFGGLKQAAMFAFWYGSPLVVRAFGRLPMKRLVGGEDLPAGVALEWARWGRHPDYLWSYASARGGASYPRIQAPLLSYAISDDGYAPVRSVEALNRLYTAARTELRLVEPRSQGVKSIGHFGFFRERFADPLWREALAWMLKEAQGPGV